MSFQRFALSLALLLTVVLACLSARQPRQVRAETISARELLDLTQTSSGANYTFDHSTSQVLAATRVPRPPEDATRAALESALRDSGFGLRSVGTSEGNLFLVERIDG